MTMDISILTNNWQNLFLRSNEARHFKADIDKKLISAGLMKNALYYCIVKIQNLY